AHYRALGVAGFLIYDDRSQAPTRDFLAAQPDCLVVTSDHSFGDFFDDGGDGQFPRRLPQVLKESVPERLCCGRWVLTVDLDEFLVLPEGVADLPAFTDLLDQAGQPYATAPLVDFYPRRLAMRNHPTATPPFEANPYFDAGPYYVWREELIPRPFAGGVRFKLLRMLHEAYPHEVERIYRGGYPYLAKSWKVPLLKHGAGVRRIADHEIDRTPSTRIAAALAHFKFYPGLDAKVARALAEGQYHAGSVEYAFLASVLDRLAERDLVTWETRRFEGPRSLEASGLLPRLPPAMAQA
ncbi:MAG TPA: glycosyltransferase family 2 protein, partial [Caulobacteraceae bacterium]|nr:glycosyltransferase family 2 protein [Caulobacteraceae bacterium]